MLFAAMCVIWGIPYLLIRVAVRDLDPAMLVLARTSLAALLLLPLAAYRRELRLEDEEVSVTCRLERLGGSSVTTREEIRAGEELATEAEAVLVPRGGDGGSRPLSDAERAALEAAA